MIAILSSNVKLSSLAIFPQEGAAPLSSLNNLSQSVSFRTRLPAPVRPNTCHKAGQVWCSVAVMQHREKCLYSPAAEDAGGSMTATDLLPPSDLTPANCYSCKINRS